MTSARPRSGVVTLDVVQIVIGEQLHRFCARLNSDTMGCCRTAFHAGCQTPVQRTGSSHSTSHRCGTPHMRRVSSRRNRPHPRRKRRPRYVQTRSCPAAARQATPSGRNVAASGAEEVVALLERNQPFEFLGGRSARYRLRVIVNRPKRLCLGEGWRPSSINTGSSAGVLLVIRNAARHGDRARRRIVGQRQSPKADSYMRTVASANMRDAVALPVVAAVMQEQRIVGVARGGTRVGRRNGYALAGVTSCCTCGHCRQRWRARTGVFRPGRWRDRPLRVPPTDTNVVIANRPAAAATSSEQTS